MCLEPPAKGGKNVTDKKNVSDEQIENFVEKYDLLYKRTNCVENLNVDGVSDLSRASVIRMQTRQVFMELAREINGDTKFETYEAELKSKENLGGADDKKKKDEEEKNR